MRKQPPFGEFDASLAHCRRALEDKGRNSEVPVVTGNIYVRKVDLLKGAEIYYNVLKANPDQFEAKQNLKRIGTL